MSTVSTITALHPACRLTVVIPARNEAVLLGSALAALLGQREISGAPLAPNTFDVIVFANNCSDATAAVARRHAGAGGPGIRIMVLERELRTEDAHIGAARKVVMDLAAARFRAAGQPRGIIASTDSDTVVAADWVAWTLRESEDVDAVAGLVTIGDFDQERLPAPVRSLYARELTYRRLLAEVEALIDPVPTDPVPRHCSFVGASFAVNARTYVDAGALPPLARLEDQNFCRALMRVDARIRHSTFVRATTSPRINGRVEGGFGSFIAHLNECAERGETFAVENPHEMLELFSLRAALRRWWNDERAGAAPYGLPARFDRPNLDWATLRAQAGSFGTLCERVASLTQMPAQADVSVDAAIETLRAAAYARGREFSVLNVGSNGGAAGQFVS